MTTRLTARCCPSDGVTPPMRTSISCGGQLAGDATVPAVMLLQWPAVRTQPGVTSVPLQRKGPKVISATAGYSPGLASLPPTTACAGPAPAPGTAAATSPQTCGYIPRMDLPPGPRLPRAL